LVTTADVTALETDSQVEPLLASGQAVLAAIDLFRQLDDLDVTAVAAEGHVSRLLAPWGAVMARMRDM
jgi:hypothetical protein